MRIIERPGTAGARSALVPRSDVPRAAALALTAALVVLAAPLGAQDVGSDIVVSASGLRNDRGTVRCYLFSSAEGYPTRPLSAVARDVVAVTSERTARCTFRGVAPGDYAVALHHDEDGDGLFDTGIFGIPTEGTAASRDARGSLGPPSFADARFTHAGAETRLDVRMQYVF